MVKLAAYELLKAWIEEMRNQPDSIPYMLKACDRAFVKVTSGTPRPPD